MAHTYTCMANASPAKLLKHPQPPKGCAAHPETLARPSVNTRSQEHPRKHTHRNTHTRKRSTRCLKARVQSHESRGDGLCKQDRDWSYQTQSFRCCLQQDLLFFAKGPLVIIVDAVRDPNAV